MDSTLSRRELLEAAGSLYLSGSKTEGKEAAPRGGENAKGPIGDLLRDAHARYGLSALLCGVWEGDKEVLSVALGNSMTGVPATKEMQMRVGGVTLTCLCVMILRLVDKGLLSLDDRLSRWYPELPQADAVTLRMLANCSAGYPDFVLSKRFQDDFYENPFRTFTPQELIDYALATPPLYKPGTGWNYSHTNFVILGNVLQRALKQPVANLMKREIFNPLRLKHTDFPQTPDIREPVLHAYTLERKVFEDSTYWNPSWTSYSGLMTSNLQDLGVIARAIGAGSLLSKSSRKEQVAPTTVGLGQNLPNLYYGLGIIMINTWMVQNPRFGGYNLIFAHLPSRRLSIVLSTTKGLKSDPDIADSTRIFKDMVKILTPDTLIPDVVS